MGSLFSARKAAGCFFWFVLLLLLLCSLVQLTDRGLALERGPLLSQLAPCGSEPRAEHRVCSRDQPCRWECLRLECGREEEEEEEEGQQEEKGQEEEEG